MDRAIFRVLSPLLLTALLLPGCSTPGRSYPSPEAAADSLVSAARSFDKAELRKILGSESDKLLSSGDEVQDRNAAALFVQKYDAKHSLTADSDDTRTMVIGDNDWPFPIPIVRDEGKPTWSFDTEAGIDEVINRRIGRNELAAIQVCHAIVDAQREYARADPDKDGVPSYAQKFMSDAGKKNGLYWPTGGSEPPSPLGPLVSEAAGEGYSHDQPSSGGPRPYHGYMFHILRSQGARAKGGAKSYVVNGHMIGGFAVVAWPAEYGSSGIMTFLVNHDGVVFQRDLGDQTDRTAREMTAFDPDEGWKPVETQAPAK